MAKAKLMWLGIRVFIVASIQEGGYFYGHADKTNPVRFTCIIIHVEKSHNNSIFGSLV